MNALCFAPKINVDGKKDADEFRSQALAFMKLHSVPAGRLFIFDNSKNYQGRAQEVIAALDRCEDKSLDCVAIFCHGWRDGLQIGVHKALFDRFIASLIQKTKVGAKIVLYACSAGRDGDNDTADETKQGLGDDGGFTDRCRDAVVKAGHPLVFFAHTTDGHCTRNPFVRRFDNTTTASGPWVVEPGSSLWASWRANLQPKKTLQFRFPFMSQEQIEAELKAS